jgi:hypothetical protein
MIGEIPNPLGDPPALPGRQQQLGIFGSVIHSFSFEKAVHEHVHVNDHADEFRSRDR